MNVQPVTHTASKEEELETLEKLTKKIFQPGTYINDLFNERFLAWIRQAIRNDFTPDIFLFIDGLQDDANRYMSTATRLQSELDTEKRTNARTIGEMSRNHNIEIQDLSERLERTNRTLDYMREQDQKSYKALGDAARQIENLTETLEAAKTENARLQNELNALKARIFDSQMRNNTPVQYFE